MRDQTRHLRGQRNYWAELVRRENYHLTVDFRPYLRQTVESYK